MIIYWCRDDYEGIEKFDKELFYEHSITEVTSKFLYRDSIDQIKRELCSGRGVSVDIRTNDEVLNKETWAQYFDGRTEGDPHAVCIVGWDDDYDASNFSTAPPGNGAWIVKNSYGSQTDMIPGGLVLSDGTTRDANVRDWGIVDENGLHTGCFYISYYDAGIGALESYDFDLRENHDQENALQLDYTPASTDEWIVKDEIPIWCANVFTLDKDMRIDEVATRFSMPNEVPLTGFTVTFEIYRLNDGASAPDDGELLTSCTREFRNYGYHRVAFDTPVYSRAGDRLAVVTQHRHDYEDGSKKYCASAQVSIDYESNPRFRFAPLYGTPIVNKGESFIKIEGITEKSAMEGWLDMTAPYSIDILHYFQPGMIGNPMMAYFERTYPGRPINEIHNLDNFGIKAFGEQVTLEFAEAVEADCENAGSLAYWYDPLSGAIFEDELGMKSLTWDDVLVSPLGHDWGEPTYTWTGDNSRVTAKSICRRETDHVLEESVDTTFASDSGAGKITWTAQFENGIFTTQTRSADAEPVCDESDEGIVNRQSTPVVRTCTVKKASAAPAAKNSDTTVIHPAPVPTGDDAGPALWYTLLAEAMACLAAVFTLHRRRRHTVGTLAERADSDCRR